MATDKTKIKRLLSCSTSAEAHIIKDLLSEANIPCMLSNDNMSRLCFGLTTGFSDVDIFVIEDQLEEAQEVLRIKYK